MDARNIGGLGPIIYVRQVSSSTSGVAEASDAHGGSEYALGTPLELRSLNHEVKRLLAYVDLLTKHHEVNSDQKETSYRDALEALRENLVHQCTEEKESLTRRIAHLEHTQKLLEERLESASTSETRADALENENRDLRRRLLDQEQTWASMLATKDSKLKDHLQEVESDNQQLSERASVLLRTVSDLERTLRSTVAEKESLERHISEEPQRQNELSLAVIRKAKELERDLNESERRNAALEALLTDLQKEAAGRERSFEEQLNAVRQDLLQEQRRSEQLAALYCGQIEQLHQQLEQSLNKNRLLLMELQREKGGGG